MKKIKKKEKILQYDYLYPNKKDILTRDGKKPDIILIPGLSDNTLIEIGNLGFLKGQAYLDYLERKGGNKCLSQKKQNIGK